MMKSDGVEESMDRIERFNLALEAVIRKGEARDEQLGDHEAAMLSISRELIQADLGSLSKKRAETRNRLMAEKSSARKPVLSKVRWAAGVAVVVLLAVLSFATIPPLRAWAQEVIARIGHLIITDAPTYEEQFFEEMQTMSPGKGKASTVIPQSLQAVRARVDFPVLVPRDFPQNRGKDIYAPPWAIDRDMTWTSESVSDYQKGVTVSGIYKRWHSVNIHQLKLTDERVKEFPVSDARVQEVVVRNQRGSWIEAAPTGLLESYGSIWPNNKTESVWILERQDLLVWEENGVMYIIQADDELELKDLLTIAEALSED